MATIGEEYLTEMRELQRKKRELFFKNMTMEKFEEIKRQNEEIEKVHPAVMGLNHDKLI